MPKLQMTLTGAGLIALAWLSYANNVGTCGTVFLLPGLCFLLFAFLKYQQHAKLPQQVLEQHASTLSNQQHYREQSALPSADSSRMFVPPALDD